MSSGSDLTCHTLLSNHRDVLDSARGRKKTEVEEIVARLAPRPDARSFVRRVSTHRVELEAATQAELLDVTPAVPSSGAAASPARPDPPMAVPSRPAAGVVEALSPDRYKLQVTISGDTLEKLRLAQDMLGHSIPFGDDAAILDRALTALLADLAKRKFAATSRPRSPSGRRPGAGTPSAAVKRAVWLRDLGRCAFVGTSGHRGGARRFVEFHHVDPYALGGEATVDGIQLRCRRHNDYEGRLYFGNRRPAPELVLEQVQLTAERSM